ncbi:hypothetical protein YPC_1812 [Yersinia pestis biovar Medievalis str. Harbin 35]|nr:hypothetical protein YPC_1812 [Yersinia pestis biovar Medievalis str. Harbin 35]EEO77106.1 hypothetical protein YP516_1841 [Yersinia pestis Nepal516]EEO80615.1 hypothetical protein YPF_2685 [Yersinia pestis biovar Orientalis str. India 195]EEO83997.1 hypothetical protein YPH_4645 [Yersinia pestis biovar Orientalis str. PEXU2]EEO90178.1 hypothetical protein YPS_2644 [Yersinia pestis Pestoides A]
MTVCEQDLRPYDDILYRNQLAFRFWLLVTHCRGNIAYSDETQGRSFCYGLVTDYLHSAIGGDNCLPFIR